MVLDFLKKPQNSEANCGHKKNFQDSAKIEMSGVWQH